MIPFAVFCGVAAVACFSTGSHPITIRIVGATVFLVCLAYLASTLRDPMAKAPACPQERDAGRHLWPRLLRRHRAPGRLCRRHRPLSGMGSGCRGLPRQEKEEEAGRRSTLGPARIPEAVLNSFCVKVLRVVLLCCVVSYQHAVDAIKNLDHCWSAIPISHGVKPGHPFSILPLLVERSSFRFAPRRKLRHGVVSHPGDHHLVLRSNSGRHPINSAR
jgi:hypothetical protein